MGISRRRFVAGVGIGALWTALPGTGIGILAGTPALAAPPAPSRAFDLGTATAATFRPHLGSRFRLQRQGQRALDLELAGIESQPADGATDSFSLQFSAAKPVGLVQAAYRLEHTALGAFNLFVVPVGSRLVAVVNHTLDDAPLS